MDSIPNNFPISLRSWPSSNGNDALPTIIQRINLERGGFQNITEESLRQEIAEEEMNNGNDGSSEDEEEEETDRAKELNNAREELLGHIEQAHQEALVSLDFISLLLSKDTPVQASLSMSPALQAMVGAKTLGADKLAASKITDAQKLDNKQIAKGWKVQNLNKTVDSILASASRLEKEIEHETKYWEQVLAVSDNGWAVCRLPNEKHILGVRFGFPEASPAFKNRSLAALRRNADGTVSLDQGLSDSGPKTLRVRVQVDGEFTGSSTVPSSAPEGATIESLILQARNTIFSEELWQELNREYRTLEPVQSKGHTLICQISPLKSIVVDLVPLGETESPSSTSGPDHAIAEGVFLALNILLSHAHRETHRRRTQIPPPISSQKRVVEPYNLLRALIARLKHQEVISQMHGLLRPLCRVLTSASISPPPTHTLTPSIWTPPPSLPTAETTVLSLMAHLELVTTLTLSPTTIITIKTITHLTPLHISFHLTLTPADSPLRLICPPPPVLTSFRAVREYLLFATSCALAETFTSPGPSSWIQTAQPNILQQPLSAPDAKKSKQLAISLFPLQGTAGSGDKQGVKLKVLWEWMRGEMSGVAAEEGEEKAERKNSLFGEGGYMDEEGGVGGATTEVDNEKGKEKEKGWKPKKRIMGEGFYEWVAWDEGSAEWDDGEGEVVRSLVDVVESAGK